MTVYRQAMPAVGMAGFLKMNKDGTWQYGIDATEPHPDSVWLIDPYSFGHGWIAWGDGAVENEVYKYLNEPLPQKSSLDPVDAENGWEEQRGFALVCISGHDQGEQVVFKTNSKGGLDAIRAVADAVADVLDESDNDSIYPKTLLRNTSYKHKKYGKIFKPIFELVGWSDNRPVAAVPEPKAKRQAEPEPIVDSPRQATGRRRRGLVA